MPNSKWLDKYSDKPTLRTGADVKAAMKRVTLPEHGMLKHYSLELKPRFDIFEGYNGYYVQSNAYVPDVDKELNPLAPVHGSWHLPALPISERQLMNFLMAHVRSSFLHEFEEHFMVDGERVLHPHGSEPLPRSAEMGVAAP